MSRLKYYLLERAGVVGPTVLARNRRYSDHAPAMRARSTSLPKRDAALRAWGPGGARLTAEEKARGIREIERALVKQ